MNLSFGAFTQMYYSTAFQVHLMLLPIAVASNVYPSNRYESRGSTGNVTQQQWHSGKTTVKGKEAESTHDWHSVSSGRRCSHTGNHGNRINPFVIVKVGKRKGDCLPSCLGGQTKWVKTLLPTSNWALVSLSKKEVLLQNDYLVSGGKYLVYRVSRSTLQLRRLPKQHMPATLATL